MQAVSIANRKCSIVDSWFDRHLPELTQRCRSYFRSLPTVERDEAMAETLAGIFLYTMRAAARGKLRRLTPYTLVWFFGRSCRAGRRMAGYTSTDVMAEAARRRHHHEVLSLHQPLRIQVDHHEIVAPLSEVLADSREDSPLENVRKNVDYPEILQRERISPKGRRVFEYLCQTHGAGSHQALARELGVAPSRITQIKRRLAACLARHGYGPPATRRAHGRQEVSGRSANNGRSHSSTEVRRMKGRTDHGAALVGKVEDFVTRVSTT